jgi:phosphatidate phosphatase LPIN
MPIVGKDWSHAGVVSLYNSIIARGYRILYLSSRAIGQADTTKSYLSNLEQENRLLPLGPVLMSPERIMKSFMIECVYKEPHIFKASVLKQIKGLFPRERYPFFAGFGNKDTDAIAYRAADIPLHKIFIIDPKGKLHCRNSTFDMSYDALNQLSDQMFPHLVDNDHITSDA